MLFTSGEFLFLYLPVTLVGFFVLAALMGRAAAAGWLVLASLFFYGYWRPEHTILLCVSIACNYAVGVQLQRAGWQQAARGRALLVFGVTANLLALAWFKYAGFLTQTAASVIGYKFEPLAIALPIGISFFTFTQIAYLVDSWAGKVRERNPIHYALFVSYFPHLISGPVLHHADMMPQFAQRETYRPRVRYIAGGLAFFVIGLAKKVLLADSAAPLANATFDPASVASLGTPAAWAGVLAYSLQIYFDFSGYSDMAVGLSLLFGVRLPFNFDSPYKALDIISFWRRWHMTLSRFLRDYLYVALGGNRKGKVRRYINLLLTMLLGGLWHGASWTFVAWGALHGIYLVLNHAWQAVRHRWLPVVPKSRHPLWEAASRALSWLLTFGAVTLAWVYFRAPDFATANQIVQALFAGSHSGATVEVVTWLWLVAGIAVCVALPNSQQLIAAAQSLYDRRMGRADLRMVLSCASGALVIVASVLVLISASREVSEFIYFNF